MIKLCKIGIFLAHIQYDFLFFVTVCDQIISLKNYSNCIFAKFCNVAQWLEENFFVCLLRAVLFFYHFYVNKLVPQG